MSIRSPSSPSSHDPSHRVPGLHHSGSLGHHSNRSLGPQPQASQNKLTPLNIPPPTPPPITPERLKQKLIQGELFPPKSPRNLLFNKAMNQAVGKSPEEQSSIFAEAIKNSENEGSQQLNKNRDDLINELNAKIQNFKERETTLRNTLGNPESPRHNPLKFNQLLGLAPDIIPLYAKKLSEGHFATLKPVEENGKITVGEILEHEHKEIKNEYEGIKSKEIEGALTRTKSEKIGIHPRTGIHHPEMVRSKSNLTRQKTLNFQELDKKIRTLNGQIEEYERALQIYEPPPKSR